MDAICRDDPQDVGCLVSRRGWLVAPGVVTKTASGAKKSTMGAMDSDSDRLLERFAAGDAEAFVAFYRVHLPAILGWFLRRTRDRELTADLTAETFCAALIAAPRFDPAKGSALAWLYGIAGHKLVDSRRQGVVEARARRRLQLVPLQLDDDDLLHVEELASLTPSQPELDEALRALPEAQREAILARVVQQRPYDEIAEQMQCSNMVVRQRVARGLRALRGRLGERG
jgi:RNA polymerase sigma-70 factor (ECF subfamily)